MRRAVINSQRTSRSCWFAACATLVATVNQPQAAEVASFGAVAGRDEIAAVVDEVIPRALQEQHVAGAVVAVVSGCEKIYSRGFGWAEVARQRPMDADQTLFRIGSISKVITATVAMNLASRGLLDLQTDVRRYLPQGYLQTAFDDPITMTDLLTHAAGFGERWTDLGVERADEIQPYEEYLAEFPPPQVRHPRTIKIYNSTAFALAALVMERITRRGFAELTHDVLLQPAGMQTQTLLPTAQQVARLSTGYLNDGAPFERDYYLQIAPGGDGVASADDMAQFVKLHLGCSNGSSVLSPRDLAEMHRTHFTHDPAVAGMALGFEEFRWKGRVWLKKAGGAPGVTTFIAFLPGSGFGFFVAVNADQSPLWRSLMIPFADRYAAYPQHEAIPVDAPPALDAAAYAGWYRPLRHANDNLEKLFGLLQVRVVADGPGRLRYRGKQYRSIGGHLFQSQDNAQVLGFRARPNGKPDFLFQDGSDGYEAVSWCEGLTAQLSAAAAFALIFVFAGGHATARIVRRRMRFESATSALPLAAGIALLNALFFGGMGYSLATFDIWTLHFGVPPGIRYSMLLPPLAVAALLALAWNLFRMRGMNGLRPGERVTVAAIAAAAALFIPFLLYWNLLELPT